MPSSRCWCEMFAVPRPDVSTVWRTLKSFEVAQQLVPSVLKIAALSTWPVPTKLCQVPVSMAHVRL